jgi:hypothetical protein
VTLSGIATDDALVVFAKSADDEGRLVRATVLGADEQRFLHVVLSCMDSDGDAALAACVSRAPPFAGLPQGLMDALAFADDNLARLYG